MYSITFLPSGGYQGGYGGGYNGGYGYDSGYNNGSNSYDYGSESYGGNKLRPMRAAVHFRTKEIVAYSTSCLAVFPYPVSISGMG